MITGKLYDVLKFCALVAFPAVGTLYVALAALWGLPSVQAVSGTILAIDTFLGAILQISSASYNKQIGGGVANVIPKEGGGVTYDLVLDGDPSELADMKEVHFKVNQVQKTKKIAEPMTRSPRTSSTRRRPG